MGEFLGHNMTGGMVDGGIFVITDMSLSLLSVICNLMVLTSLREKESLLSVLYNLILANLCLSNLVSSVLVKSISIVHYGYAVSTKSLESDMAFCYLYTASFRTTWAVLPWSLVILTFNNISFIYKHIKVERNRAITEEAPKTLSLDACSFTTGLCSSTTEDTKLVDEDDTYKLTGKDKGVLASLWFFGVVNSLLSSQVISKDPDLQCSIEDDLSSHLSLASIFMIILLPTLFGPLLLIFIHLSFFIYRRMTGMTRCSTLSDQCPTVQFLCGLYLIYCISYIPNMIISEQGIVKRHVFVYVMLKYVLGTSYQLLTPMWVLASRRDIWDTAVMLYRRGGTTQSKSLEMTYEQIQKELGLGVMTD